MRDPADGRAVTCWGSNEYGQASPPPDLGAASALSAASWHTCAIRQTDRAIVCWGDVSEFQPPPSDLGAVSEVGSGYGDTCAIRVSVGNTHACAIRQADATVVCWGSNLHGEASPPPDLGAASAVGAGNSHTCAIRQADGIVVCWGNNAYGKASP